MSNINTLYFDDGGIRLLATAGQKIKKWAYLPLEEGLIDNGIVCKEAEVAGLVEQLLKENRVKGKKVIAGLSGLLCLTRPIMMPQLPRTMLGEAVEREALRLFSLPPDQFYLLWETIPAPRGKTQVFLAAIRRRSADTLMRTLDLAGLKPSALDLKPLALSRMARGAAVIVDIQPGEFDVIVQVDGVPQPIRTITFPAGMPDLPDRLEMITGEIDRTTRFYNSNNPERPLPPQSPVFVSGPEGASEEVLSSLSAALARPAFPLQSSLNCPENFDPSSYAVNFGLALKSPQLRKKAGPLVVDLNLLPVPYHPRGVPWGKVGAVPGVIVAGGLLTFMGTLVQDVSARADMLNSQLEAANQLISQKQQKLQQMKKEVEKLQGEVAGAQASRDRFARAWQRIDRLQETINGDLQLATDKGVLGNVALVNTGHNGGTLSLNGRAPTEKDVLAYARRLSDSGRFAGVIINIKVDPGGVDFSLVLKKG